MRAILQSPLRVRGKISVRCEIGGRSVSAPTGASHAGCAAVFFTFFCAGKKRLTKRQKSFAFLLSILYNTDKQTAAGRRPAADKPVE